MGKVILLSALIWGLPAFAAPSENTEIEKIFSGRDACLIVSDLATGKVVREFNPARCKRRKTPCSSFKIAAALMGFESGALKDADQTIPWDGTRHSRAELNQDQTPHTWMSHSVIWVTRWIMSRLSDRQIAGFLHDFSYGNRDFSGGKTRAWVDSSLKVSPEEQMRFIAALWRGKLPVSKRTTEFTRKILFIQDLGKSAKIYGKTGTGCLDPGCAERSGRMIGTFVGVLEADGRSYAFAANGDDLKPERRPGGQRMRDDVIRAFRAMKLISN